MSPLDTFAYESYAELANVFLISWGLLLIFAANTFNESICTVYVLQGTHFLSHCLQFNRLKHKKMMSQHTTKFTFVSRPPYLYLNDKILGRRLEIKEFGRKHLNTCNKRTNVFVTCRPVQQYKLTSIDILFGSFSPLYLKIRRWTNNVCKRQITERGSDLCCFVPSRSLAL